MRIPGYGNRDGIDLQAITAPLVGGSVFFGGRADVMATLGAVLFLGVTANMLV